MNIALWALAGLAAAIFLMAGLMKATQPKAKLAANGMAWTEDFAQNQIRLIGLAEILGALGLVLPGATGIATWLVPVAAALLAVTMVGAIVTHVRRSEPATPAIVLLVLALVVAVGRAFVAF